MRINYFLLLSIHNIRIQNVFVVFKHLKGMLSFMPSNSYLKKIQFTYKTLSTDLHKYF